MKTRILLIEDDPGITTTLQRVLASDGHEVAIERRGDGGLTRAKTEAFDVILCDVKLPGLSGLDVVKELHAARPRLVEPVEAEVPAAAAVAPSRRNAAPTPILTSTPLIEKEGHEANSTLTPGSIPAFLKDVPTEQIKTLKCQECGTMNYPTEWYCERCGGELAAM